MWYVITVLKVLGIAASAALLGLILWVMLSPMPVVRLLRRGQDAPMKYPPDYEQRKERVLCHRDLAYPSHQGRNRFDLYLPKEPKGAYPVVLWIHGGAFVAGDKAGVENWATCLASEGLAVAAATYQWAPEAHWPSQVSQMAECCRHLCRIAEEYHLDMRRVILAGDSAGAHIAAQLALIHTSVEFSRLSGLKPCLAPGALQAALLYCGPYDITLMAHPKDRKIGFFLSRIGWSYLGKHHWQNTFAAKLTQISCFVTSDFPPAYLTDGNAFSFEPQGRALLQALNEKGVITASRFFPAEQGEVPHEYQFSMDEPSAQLCYKDTVDFLRQLRLLPEYKEEIL